MARRATVPIVLAVLALAALAGGWWLLAGRDTVGSRATPTPADQAGPPASAAGADGAPAATLPSVQGDARTPGTSLGTPVVPLGEGSPGRRAFGRVVDQAGVGIADAQLSCFREAATSSGPFARTREPLKVTARTDSGGRFELLDLPLGSPLGVEVRQADFASVELTPFTVSEAQSTDLGDIVLGAGLLLIGNVLAVDGRPLPGANVTLTELGAPSGADGGPEPRLATTRDDGEYRIDHLAPRQFTVEVHAAGFAPRAATLALVFGAATGNVRQDFRLQPVGAAIAGQVIDPDERPVPGASLRLSQRDRNAHDYFAQTGASDAEGRFRFDEVAAGLYQLELLGSDWYLPKPLTVLGGEQLDVRVQRARSVLGRLEGAAGPPRDFTVSVKPTPGTGARLLGETRPVLDIHGADPAGTFTFGGLAPGTYRFDIRAAGYAVTTSADVILGAEIATAELLVTLDAGGTIDGRVAPAAAGTAVELRAADYDPVAPMEAVLPTKPVHDLATLTDAQGAFRLEHVPAGRYTLTARATGIPPLHVRELEVLEGGRLDLGLLELPRGGVIFGNVLGLDGQPSVGARVTALASDQQEQTVTDATGAFRLPPLPAGEYDLRAVPAAMWEALRYEAQAHVTLGAGEETPVLLTFTERAVTPR